MDLSPCGDTAGAAACGAGGLRRLAEGGLVAQFPLLGAELLLVGLEVALALLPGFRVLGSGLDNGGQPVGEPSLVGDLLEEGFVAGLGDRGQGGLAQFIEVRLLLDGADLAAKVVEQGEGGVLDLLVAESGAYRVAFGVDVAGVDDDRLEGGREVAGELAVVGFGIGGDSVVAAAALAGVEGLVELVRAGEVAFEVVAGGEFAEEGLAVRGDGFLYGCEGDLWFRFGGLLTFGPRLYRLAGIRRTFGRGRVASKEAGR